MPRKARIDASGALHHIIVRGIERRNIFYDDRDRDHFLERLIETKDVLAPGKYALNVKARSLLCYWAARELGMTTVDLARRLNLAQPTVSQAVARGQKIVEDLGLSLIE